MRHYDLSPCGRVFRGTREISRWCDNRGDLCVKMDGRKVKLAPLLARTFIKNHGRNIVRFRDCDKRNCRLSNLVSTPFSVSVVKSSKIPDGSVIIPSGAVEFYPGMFVTRGGRILRNYKFQGFKSGDVVPLVSTGYLRVRVGNNKKFVHRIVAEAFIDNPHGHTQVDHINRNHTDNRVENLRWVSASDNANNRLKAKQPPPDRSVPPPADEVWRPILDVEMSSYGRMRRGDVLISGTLSPYVRHKRYGTFHRLVWQAFVGEIPRGTYINHKNRDKTDNRLVNLELVTHSDNIKHSNASPPFDGTPLYYEQLRWM